MQSDVHLDLLPPGIGDNDFDDVDDDEDDDYDLDVLPRNRQDIVVGEEPLYQGIDLFHAGQ